MGGRLLRHDRFNVLFKRIYIFNPQGLCQVVWALKPVGSCHHFFTKNHPHFLRSCTYGDITVQGSVCLIRCCAPMSRAGGNGDFAGAKISAKFPGRPGQSSFQQGGFQVLPFAKTQLANQCAQNARKRGDAACNVVHGDANFGRPTTRMAGHHHDARHALGNDVKSAFLAIGSSLAKARHRCVDHAGVVCADAVVIYPHALHHTRSKVFHHDVCFCSQLVGDL